MKLINNIKRLVNNLERPKIIDTACVILILAIGVISIYTLVVGGM